MEKCDFSGWATRNNLQCSDGRTILKDAFKHNDGQTVPLVWNHQHNDPFNVLGHALLENRDEGVYAYCCFNDTEAGKNAKLVVEHGDVVALSIYANQLKQKGPNVLHGAIREVSLVLAGANPGAYIDEIMQHGADSEDNSEEAIIYTGENIALNHAEDETTPDDAGAGEKEIVHMATETKTTPETKDTTSGEEETVADVFNTLSEKQKTVVYAMIGQALEDNAGTTEGGDTTMKQNVFDHDETEQENVLSHSEMTAIIGDAKRYGSLKDSVLQHGITNVDYLFPDATAFPDAPQFIQRNMGWVQNVMQNVHHTPFSRLKSIFADITADEARAKGYVKGNLKVEEVFTLLKRTTTPTTVYKKQKMDRDDMVDITDFDVVAFLKSEMRLMLDEEIARALLIGDGRLGSSDDKINETNIRPIWKDDALYAIKASIDVSPTTTADQRAKAFIRACVKNRKEYKGSGNPTLYCTEDILTDCLLMEDTTGRVIYETPAKLATALRVTDIVTVEVMENQTRVDTSTYTLLGIIVNLNDYNIGADKGGAVNMFDDFDIDYNRQKYLIETRCSGALIKPKSAIVIEAKAVAA